MPDISGQDATLPSVVASVPGAYRDAALYLTIVFHPDTGRIGQRALVPRSGGSLPTLLGRHDPAFGPGVAGEGDPLGDPHVSRQALELDYDGSALLLRRLPGSSRCRVAGRELQETVELDRDQLRGGVRLLLAHSVVLLLHLGEVIADAPAVGGGSLLGDSAYMRSLRREVARAADSDMDVLVLGETGTGKELVASAIHGASRRSGSPLVSVNMAAITPELAPAALFGSARGAFTGADRAGVGYFQQARGGTLFLDEIGDAPQTVQPLLLRALQQREIQPVGGRIERVDLRVISATDAALEGDGCDFKAALRHRLGATEIRLLPLREHPEDIGELLLHFLTAAAQELGREQLLPLASGSPLAIAAWADLFHGFLGYGWPGNVRELANFARQVVLASDAGLQLPEHIGAALRETGMSVEQAVSPPPARRNIQEVPEAEFDRAHEANDFEVLGTARQLNVSRQSVYRRIEESPRHRLAGLVPLPEIRDALAACDGDCVEAARRLRVSVAGLRARLRVADQAPD